MNFSLVSMAWLRALPIRDVPAVAPLLPPSARFVVRAHLIRDTISRHYGSQPRTPAAKSLAADLAAAPVAGTLKAEAVAAILLINGGRAIGWRQVVNVLDFGPL